MNYKGTIKAIMNEQKISEKFKKREFVLTDNAASYPQTIIFELTNDRCALLDTFKEGQEVEIDFQLKGREWKNPQGEIKYFNTLQAFRMFAVNAQGGGSTPPKAQSAPAKGPRQAPKQGGDFDGIDPTPDDSLPF